MQYVYQVYNLSIVSSFYTVTTLVKEDLLPSDQQLCRAALMRIAWKAPSASAARGIFPDKRW